MIELISFEDAIIDSQNYSKRHLILGNGFSIGCFPSIFHYSSLYNRADFSNTQELQKVFDVFQTQDFELVLRALNNGVNLLPIYVPNSQTFVRKMQAHVDHLKELLIKTISENHPRVPSDIAETKYFHCKKFINYFLGEGTSGQVYTLNYDLLLYWVLMHSSDLIDMTPIKLSKNDGFGNVEDEFDTSYVIWQGQANSGQQRVHYLHGALHLFDAGYELKKYTWLRSGISLIEQIRQALENNEFPLFVSEGTSQQKMTRIEHHAYLHHSYKSLIANCKQKAPCFFIYGHSLADNDNHILRKLGKGKFPKLYISLFGNPSDQGNKHIIQQAQKLAALRDNKHPLSLVFYDSSTANVWGDNDF